MRTHAEAMIRSIAARTSDKRFSVLTREVTRAKTDELRAVIMESIAEKPTSKSVSLATKFARSKNERVQVAAFDILLNKGSKKHEKLFPCRPQARPLDGPYRMPGGTGRAACRRSPRTRLSSTRRPRADEFASPPSRCCVIAAARPVIEPLYQALDANDGRVQDDIADTLARLTGKDFGPASAQWESWWRSNKSKYKPGELVAMSAEAFAALKAEQAEASTLLYHGLRVVSKRPVFILDCSESMKLEYVPIAEARKQRKKQKDKKDGDTKVERRDRRERKGDNKPSKKGRSGLSHGGCEEGTAYGAEATRSRTPVQPHLFRFLDRRLCRTGAR